MGAQRRSAGPWSLANRLSNLATGLVTVGVVARTQGEDRFGVWYVVVAVATGLMVADLGLGNALVRESGLLVAEGRRSGAVGLLGTARRRVMLVVALPAAAAATAASTLLVSADVQVLGLSGWGDHTQRGHVRGGWWCPHYAHFQLSPYLSGDVLRHCVSGLWKHPDTERERPRILRARFRRMYLHDHNARRCRLHKHEDDFCLRRSTGDDTSPHGGARACE